MYPPEGWHYPACRALYTIRSLIFFSDGFFSCSIAIRDHPSVAQKKDIHLIPICQICCLQGAISAIDADAGKLREVGY